MGLRVLPSEDFCRSGPVEAHPVLSRWQLLTSARKDPLGAVITPSKDKALCDLILSGLILMAKELIRRLSQFSHIWNKMERILAGRWSQAQISLTIFRRFLWVPELAPLPTLACQTGPR